MSGRMGTGAEAVFGRNAMIAIMDAAERAHGPGGLTGRVETDQKGEFRMVLGVGTPQVGMFFPSEGTEATDEMVAEFRKVMGAGILVVVDHEIGELAVYSVGEDGCRMAPALMSERGHTHIAWRLRISCSVMPSRSMMSLTIPSNRIRAESSKTVPRGAVLRTSSP